MKDAWDDFVDSIPRRQFFKLIEHAPLDEDQVFHEINRQEKAKRKVA